MSDLLEMKIKSNVLKLATQIIKKQDENSINNFFKLAMKSTKNHEINGYVSKVHEFYNKDEHVKTYIHNILKDTDRNCLDKFVTNFLGNHNWYGMSKRDEVGELNDTKIPYTALISPSMRCNLSCSGCYSADYSMKDDLDFNKVDELVSEMRSLGIYWVIILGGEPFFNDYMLDIYAKYDDMYFTPFTNGTLFTEQLADQLKNLGNVMPMFSLEGYEDETDSRRGPGTYQAVMNGMELLSDRGVLYGVSSATSKGNLETVTSSEFIDTLIEKGSKMNWYFMFMPVGETPVEDMSYMLSPEERMYLGKRVNDIRVSKSYFAIDFFNDAPYVNGCIAGREYFHINSKLDLEPCIFSHFATDNLKNKTLLEGLQSSFFSGIRSKQPYNDNLLMPCMMIDNPHVIRDIVNEYNAYPTHSSAELMITDQVFMDKLDDHAEAYQRMLDLESKNKRIVGRVCGNEADDKECEIFEANNKKVR